MSRTGFFFIREYPNTGRCTVHRWLPSGGETYEGWFYFHADAVEFCKRRNHPEAP